MLLKKCVNLSIKLFSMIFTFVLLLLFFSKEYYALKVPSRTLVVFIGAYLIAFSLFSNVYGTFQFGKLKSKPIFYTTSLAVFFTDICSYLSLLVMSTNPNNPEANSRFIIENVQSLFLALTFQFAFIYLISYLGNHVYFLMFKPKKTYIVVDDTDVTKLLKYFERFKMQYHLVDTINITDPNLFETISKADLVAVWDIDLENRTKILNYLFSSNIDFVISANISDTILLNGSLTTYDDMPIIEIMANTISFRQTIIKRIIDIVLSTLALIFTFPIWFIIIISIKLFDKGPVFFSQPRMTMNGEIFNVLKFRTMKVNSENYSATENDDRITNIGKIIRKIRMDELPQFLNILSGKMSFVGPRPEMLINIDEYSTELPEFKYRLKMKAGLTGLAQIEGKYNTSPENKLIMDLSYIQNYSVWLDIRLIFRTFIVFFKKDSVDGF